MRDTFCIVAYISGIWVSSPKTNMTRKSVPVWKFKKAHTGPRRSLERGNFLQIAIHSTRGLYLCNCSSEGTQGAQRGGKGSAMDVGPVKVTVCCPLATAPSCSKCGRWQNSLAEPSPPHTISQVQATTFPARRVADSRAVGEDIITTVHFITRAEDDLANA